VPEPELQPLWLEPSAPAELLSDTLYQPGARVPDDAVMAEPAVVLGLKQPVHAALLAELVPEHAVQPIAAVPEYVLPVQFLHCAPSGEYMPGTQFVHT
jgi:hypothetical protein